MTITKITPPRAPAWFYAELSAEMAAIEEAINHIPYEAHEESFLFGIDSYLGTIDHVMERDGYIAIFFALGTEGGGFNLTFPWHPTPHAVYWYTRGSSHWSKILTAEETEIVFEVFKSTIEEYVNDHQNR